MNTLNIKSNLTICRSIVTSIIFLTACLFCNYVNAYTSPLTWYQIAIERFKLKSDQLDNLILVHYYSDKSGRPDIIQALMLQESQAHSSVKSNSNCHGALQVKTSTAVSVLNRDLALKQKYFGTNPINNTSVTLQLKNNVVFSIEIADRLVAYLASKTQDTDRILYAYNRGERNILSVKNPGKLQYVKSVKQKMKTIVDPINKLHNSETDQKLSDDSIIVV